MSFQRKDDRNVSSCLDKITSKFHKMFRKGEGSHSHMKIVCIMYGPLTCSSQPMRFQSFIQGTKFEYKRDPTQGHQSSMCQSLESYKLL